MTKTINFKKKISGQPAAAAGDDWVKSRGTSPKVVSMDEPMKRFTIDVPLSLHTRVKMKCAEDGRKMADVLREILEREYPKS